ncbi:CDGSH iron-sulfur domain-containing protein [Roseovarius salinarum]|uniref:CDGSH iron-sulfur domain-containing protein n=1 Tax=Roseovarius salinarum TaxID=1981892 RepID=UPI000C33047F|nr:CDGSH iron-sulfur domain-containing protein [Roseovarius salinarum]
MTETPIIAAKTPARAELTEGETYFWCRCGRSRSQPFCDGSHEGTGLAPLRFTAQKTGPAVLCRCKASDNSPYCDGTHGKLSDRAPGDSAEPPQA